MEKFYFILIMLLCSVSVFSQTIQNSDSDMVFLDGKPDKKKSNENVINPKYVIIGTPDISGDLEEDGVRDAFDIWQAETDIAFLEVCNANNADIVISWRSWNHGDGAPFDEPNGVYAHALIGETTNPLAGDIHFDESEDWTIAETSNDNQPMDLVTFSAHEIGHAIGLDHSNVNTALMAGGHALWIQNGSHRFLTQDDIAGIQNLYGLPNSGELVDGPDALCSSGSYTIQDVPAGISVAWTVSPSHIFTNSSGTGATANLNLVNPMTVSGTATLTYTLQGTGCANTEITREIQVGPEYPDFDFYQYPTCVSPNQVVTVVANITQVDYDWTVNGGTILSGQGTQSIDINVGSSGYISVHCNVFNGPDACEGPRGTVSLYPMACFGIEDNSVTAYPNPVNDILHLRSETEENIKGEILVMDSQNTLRKSISVDSCEVTIDVSDLQPGIYHVTYSIGDRYHVKKIKIE